MFGGIQRERDSNLIQFENQIFNYFKEIVAEEDERVGYVENKPKSAMIKSLSVEDAIKELIELEKQLK
jgi:hypothetical protein